MNSYRGVLIGANGSPESAAAIEAGGVAAAALGVPAVVITVWDGFTNVPEGESYEWALAIGDAAVKVVEDAGATDVTALQPTGSAAEVLVEVAEEHPDFLLVIGGASLHRATSRVAGSVANRLSHHSPADVLFVQGPLPRAGGAVGLTTDGSATSRHAVRRGLELTLALGATPHLVTVAKDLEEGGRLMSASLGELGIDEPDLVVERDVLTGLLPAKTLIDAASDYGILAIGNRSMSGPSRLLGSVANKVTHSADTNLLLVNTSRD